MYADKDKLVVGGGGREGSGSGGGAGLMIDHDLIYGHTNECDTFENELLGAQCDFEILVLEVFSFNSNT